jgi:hypothetical protein
LLVDVNKTAHRKVRQPSVKIKRGYYSGCSRSLFGFLFSNRFLAVHFVPFQNEVHFIIGGFADPL